MLYIRSLSYFHPHRIQGLEGNSLLRWYFRSYIISHEPKKHIFKNIFREIYQKQRFSGPVTSSNIFKRFLKMRQSKSTHSVNLSLTKFCVAQPFFVELHLDDDLAVLLVFGFKFFIYQTCR